LYLDENSAIAGLAPDYNLNNQLHMPGADFMKRFIPSSVHIKLKKGLTLIVLKETFSATKFEYFGNRFQITFVCLLFGLSFIDYPAAFNCL
jgi:hypothetical protein